MGADQLNEGNRGRNSVQNRELDGGSGRSLPNSPQLAIRSSGIPTNQVEAGIRIERNVVLSFSSTSPRIPSQAAVGRKS